MGLLSFAKELGKQVFQAGQQVQQKAQSMNPQQIADEQARMIEQYVRNMGLNISNVGVQYDGSGTVILTGQAATQADYEKATLTAGNITGVSHVDNRMTVANAPAQDPKTYTVKPGDNLSKIAKEVYGDANKYPVIFEANKPMLKDPDEIYPGQVLRIPQP